MSAPSLATEVSGAGSYPSNRFNQRERKLLEAVKTYADNLAPNNVITTQGDLIIGDAGGDADRLALGTTGYTIVSDGTTFAWGQLAAAGIASNAVTTAKILDANVTLAKLSATATYTHRAVAAGTFTTAGGDTTETITAAAVVNTDIVVVTVKTAGASPVSIVAAAAGTGDITVTTSADPSTDHVLQYVVFRAAS